MRKLTIIPLLLISLITSADIIYISPTGDDGTGDGSISNPYHTIDHACDFVNIGDTLYARGGVYEYSALQTMSNLNGNADTTILISAYPGETPIIDASNRGTGTGGFIFTSCSYMKIYGFTFRNMPQVNQPAPGPIYDTPIGLYLNDCVNVTVERNIAHDIGYRGFYFYECDTLYIRYNDSYNIVDSLSDDAGDHGDGFMSWDNGSADDSISYHHYFENRAWNCSDDGYDTQIEGLVVHEKTWSGFNGLYDLAFESGSGVKIGYGDAQNWTTKRNVKNCLFLFNDAAGISTNDANFSVVKWIEAYNNTFYKNRYGISVFNTNTTDYHENKRIFRNNLAYDNTEHNYREYSGALGDDTYNSWNTPPGVTLSNADFKAISSDSATIYDLVFLSDRKSDGSLPDLGDYFKLAEGSDLIDAGTDVGLSYNGTAPDLGAFEYESAETPSSPSGQRPRSIGRKNIKGKAVKFIENKKP